MRTSIVLVVAASLLAGCASHRDGSRGPAAGAVTEGAVVLYVRLESGLDQADALAMLRVREPQFRRVPGLVQKIYGQDPATGEFCGIYIFESEAALEAFRQSELAKSIPLAYEARSVRVERYDLLLTLYPGVRD